MAGNAGGGGRPTISSSAFSAAVEIDTLAIFNIGASAATVSVAYSSDNLSYSNQNFQGIYATSIRWQVDPCRRKFLQLNTTRNAQYWRIRFANITLLNGMFEVGRICGGVSYSPAPSLGAASAASLIAAGE